MPTPLHALRALAFLGATLAGTAAGSAQADKGFATEWAPGMKSRARIIAASGDGVHYLAGIQIELTGHTVTYWRTPGDAGTPPVVSFEGSANLASAHMEYPAPRRIFEDGIEALGYQREVVFPLRVLAKDPAQPVTLRVRLDYAACEKICIPVHAESDIVLPRGRDPGPFAARLAAAAASVPVRQAAAESTTPFVTAARGLVGDWSAGQGIFHVEAKVGQGVSPVTLFAEGPSGWYLQPQAAQVAPDGRVRIPVKILQAPPGAEIAKTPFMLTLVAGDRAIEVPVRLDSKNGAF